jgi:lauroyl/myristoyl acyltransferase
MGAKDADKMPVISLRGGDKFWLKEVFKAKKVLEAGEILTLVADGRVGKGGLQHRFHDITIPFYVSFAELALQTNSTVIPVFANMDSKGKIVIELQPAFDSGDAGVAREERIHRLLDQYVACLEQEWRDNPGNILTTHVRLYNQAKAEQASVNAAKSHG